MEKTPSGEVAEMDFGLLGLFGGITEYVVIDNCPPLVAAAAPFPPSPAFTQGVLKYSQHRGFIANRDWPQHPKDTLKV